MKLLAKMEEDGFTMVKVTKKSLNSDTPVVLSIPRSGSKKRKLP